MVDLHLPAIYTLFVHPNDHAIYIYNKYTNFHLRIISDNHESPAVITTWSRSDIFAYVLLYVRCISRHVFLDSLVRLEILNSKLSDDIAYIQDACLYVCKLH